MADNLMEEAERVSRIVQDAGGRLVGRTRLQKISYLLEVMGYGDGFSFAYKHYGPYSDQLTSAAKAATTLNLLSEEEHQAAWGGFYSIFVSHLDNESHSAAERKSIANFANLADAVELELAATAILLAVEGYSNPWAETRARKMAKAEGGKLEAAKSLLEQLKRFDAKKVLPAI